MLDLVVDDADRRATGPAQRSQARQQSVARRPGADRECRRDRNALGIPPLCPQSRDRDISLLESKASSGCQARTGTRMRQHQKHRAYTERHPNHQQRRQSAKDR